MGLYLEAETLGGNEMGRMEPSLVGLVPFQEEARDYLALLLPYGDIMRNRPSGTRRSSPEVSHTGVVLSHFCLQDCEK